MAKIEIVIIDLDELDEETRALFLRCIPDEPVDLKSLLTEDVVAGAMVAGGFVAVH